MKKLWKIVILFSLFIYSVRAVNICEDAYRVYFNKEKTENTETSAVKFFDTQDMDEEYRNFVNGYQMNNKAVYYNEKILSGADSASFSYIADFYTKDKNTVYYNNIKIKNSDSGTFEYLGYRYAKDKNSVYYSGKKIRNADAKTFEIVDFYRAKDKNRYYMHGETE